MPQVRINASFELRENSSKFLAGPREHWVFGKEKSMPDKSRTTIFRTSDGCPISFTLRPASDANAPRVALIHSLALNGSVWNRVAEKLAGEAHVLTYDCRGHGKSGKEARPFTTELFAQDLAELLDHVGWPTGTVAGCSM